MDGYIKIEKIGEGTYGVVYKGRCKKTDQIVAIKKIRMEGNDEGIPSTALREVTLLKELDHPNIVSLYEVLMEENRMYLVFEFLTMNLKKFLDCQLPNSKIDTSNTVGKLDAMLMKSYLYQNQHQSLICCLSAPPCADGAVVYEARAALRRIEKAGGDTPSQAPQFALSVRGHKFGKKLYREIREERQYILPPQQRR
nr:PREDICTED: cyclin-dependent kinase 1-like [Bemisia tabaci]